MRVRILVSAVVLAATAGCADGDGDRVATRSTSTTVDTTSASSISRSTTSTSTASTSVVTGPTAGATTTVALPQQGCALEAVEYVAPASAPAPVSMDSTSGPSELRLAGRNWVRAGGRTWVGNDEESLAAWVGPIDDGDDPAMLVSRDPGCETRRVIGGSGLAALTCGDEQFEVAIVMVSGPCWATRHDPATGRPLATYGPFTDVLEVVWAGSDLVLISPYAVQVPERDWEADEGGDLLWAGTGASAWGAEGAVYVLLPTEGVRTLRRYDLDGGETVSRMIDASARVLGVHHQGVVVAEQRSDEPETHELTVWELEALEDVSLRSVSGYPFLLDTGEVVTQQTRDGDVGWEPFTTDLSVLDLASGEQTLLASFEDEIVHRTSWPTYRPRAIVDDVLVLGWAEW